MFIAETSRLFLRETINEDAKSVYYLNADPEVLQYTGDNSFKDVDEARNFLNVYDHYKLYGFGRWAVIQKDQNEFLGWCGLKYLVNENLHDIGFRFMKKYWNQGYATESAIKCLDLGFNKFHMPLIVAHADIENKASIKVIEKIGLSYQKNYFEDQRECAAFMITKEEYESMYS